METSTNEGASGGCDLLEDLSPSLRWFRLIGKKSIVTTDGPIAKPWKRLLSHKTRQLGLTNAAVASREAPPLLCVVENTLLKFKFSVGGGGGKYEWRIHRESPAGTFFTVDTNVPIIRRIRINDRFESKISYAVEG